MIRPTAEIIIASLIGFLGRLRRSHTSAGLGQTSDELCLVSRDWKSAAVGAREREEAGIEFSAQHRGDGWDDSPLQPNLQFRDRERRKLFRHLWARGST